MTDPQLHLELIAARFPNKGALIRRLCLADPSFRGLCEEYGLARNCLSRFEQMDNDLHAAEIEDYRSVIAALEIELARFLARPA